MQQAVSRIFNMQLDACLPAAVACRPQHAALPEARGQALPGAAHWLACRSIAGGAAATHIGSCACHGLLEAPRAWLHWPVRASGMSSASRAPKRARGVHCKHRNTHRVKLHRCCVEESELQSADVCMAAKWAWGGWGRRQGVMKREGRLAMIQGLGDGSSQRIAGRSRTSESDV